MTHPLNSLHNVFSRESEKKAAPAPGSPPALKPVGEFHDDIDYVSMELAGIHTSRIMRNPSPALLYEEALKYEPGTYITSTGALSVRSGERTGRSPKDKRVVREPSSEDKIWWGKINIPMDEHTFLINRERAIDYLNTRDRLYVFDGYAGWEPKYRIKVRVVCTSAYHALFMYDMLIRPTREQLHEFGEPDFTIFNAGSFPANRYTRDMSSGTSVDINFGTKEMVILGTKYAGEMKKGIFSVMHYLMPLQGVLSLHSSANEGPDGDVSLFFGLSGTGKTTLSADPARKLIGDDEHCWHDGGVFNIEGGCYAKTIGLSAEKEPEIYAAIRFGTVLENLVLDEYSRDPLYDDGSITENTRAAYPIDFISNAKIPCVGGHPSNIIMLSCDAFGVLPPVSRLTPEQAMYFFISGYTAKVAGTEVGIVEPQATFSACFGDAFLTLPPTTYAEMLADRMKKHGANAWLLNTGWIGGEYGVGKRISLKYTRAIIDAIHNGELAKSPTTNFAHFNLQVPTVCKGVPEDVLLARPVWEDKTRYDTVLKKLATIFAQNFKQYESFASEAIKNAGPKV